MRDPRCRDHMGPGERVAFLLLWAITLAVVWVWGFVYGVGSAMGGR
jgi:hypothetical protein